MHVRIPCGPVCCFTGDLCTHKLLWQQLRQCQGLTDSGGKNRPKTWHSPYIYSANPQGCIYVYWMRVNSCLPPTQRLVGWTPSPGYMCTRSATQGCGGLCHVRVCCDETAPRAGLTEGPGAPRHQEAQTLLLTTQPLWLTSALYSLQNT